ncbi:MAG: LysM peptidoglycan-binding domain-containing protein [Anaerolinea sp.]|nr:LysM peptidoglycan-binding domain-containing protein [Anaerolinea sp.]
MSRRLLPLILLLVMASASPMLAQDNVHVVQPGENLFRISLQYDVDITALAQANGITNTWQIYSGQRLVIPGVTPPAAEAPVVEEALAAPTEEPSYHTIVVGQNLAQIARLYGMSAEDLAELNNISNPNMIYAGQRLLISGTPSAGDSAEPAEENPLVNPNSIRHTVQRGENLAGIGQQYGISWLAIAQANNIIDANQIVAGQELIIPNVLVARGILDAPAAPAPIHGVGREVIVDLSDQRAYAYENGILVRNVIVSTGLPNTPTVRGDFTIQRKYAAQTMTGPGYYLPDVPYVAYFYAGYALHGTYWHNNFGQPMSHGCVNLPTPEAEWFYNFVDIGTPIHVQS